MTATKLVCFFEGILKHPYRIVAALMGLLLLPALAGAQEQAGGGEASLVGDTCRVRSRPLITVRTIDSGEVAAGAKGWEGERGVMMAFVGGADARVRFAPGNDSDPSGPARELTGCDAARRRP